MFIFTLIWHTLHLFGPIMVPTRPAWPACFRAFSVILHMTFRMHRVFFPCGQERCWVETARDGLSSRIRWKRVVFGFAWRIHLSFLIIWVELWVGTGKPIVTFLLLLFLFSLTRLCFCASSLYYIRGHFIRASKLISRHASIHHICLDAPLEWAALKRKESWKAWSRERRRSAIALLSIFHALWLPRSRSLSSMTSLTFLYYLRMYFI